MVRQQDPEDNYLANSSPTDLPLDPSVAAVLCGLDFQINYTKLSKAFLYLSRPASECPAGKPTLFLATNLDPTYPADGKFLPGAGAISAPLRLALKKDPVSLGKPSKGMMDCIFAK
jgi:4-nitrophenyl phosphatase